MSKNRVCEVCLSKPGSDHVPMAVMYCTACKQYMCNACLQYHDRFSTTAIHELQCLPPPEVLNTCYHEHTYFCGKHKHFCCETCQKKFHNSCDDVITIQNFLKKEDRVITNNQKMLQRLLDMKVAVEKDCTSTKEKEKAWIEQMNKQLKTLNNLKADLEEKVNKKVEYVRSLMKRRNENNQAKMNQLQSAINDIERNKRIIQDTTNTNTEKVKTIDKMEENFEKYMELLTSDQNEHHIDFLKADHDFEAKHYFSGTLQKFHDTVSFIDKIYSDVQQYIIPADQEKSFTAAPSTDDFHIDEDQTNVKLSQFTEQANNRQVNPRGEYTTELSDSMTLKISPGKDIAMDTETVDVQQSDSRELCMPDTSITYLKGQRQLQEATTWSNFESLTLLPESERANSPSRTLPKDSLELYHQDVKRMEKESTIDIPIQSQCKVKVRVDDDTVTCGITGISLLNNGYYILADFQNLKLKVFAPCGDLHAKHLCEEKPRDIAKLVNDEFAITFPMAKRIQFVSVKKDNVGKSMNITMGKKIETNAMCCGIAFQRDKIYVATQLPHQILIINSDGIIENTISGEHHFERATYIAVEPENSETSVIYISDPSKALVLGINTKKELKFTYRAEQPHAIATTGDGRIFVTDWYWDMETIHLVKKNGEKIGVLKLDKCHCPQKLVFCKEENLLLVSQWKDDSLITVRLQPF